MGVESGAITVYAQNAGTSPISMNRALVSGDFLVPGDNCSGTTLAGTTEDGSGSLSYCQVNVVFKSRPQPGSHRHFDLHRQRREQPTNGRARRQCHSRYRHRGRDADPAGFQHSGCRHHQLPQSVLITNPGDTALQSIITRPAPATSRQPTGIARHFHSRLMRRQLRSLRPVHAHLGGRAH